MIQNQPRRQQPPQPAKQAYVSAIVVLPGLRRAAVPEVAAYVMFKFLDKGVVMNINNIAVAPAWQGAGLGALMLEHALTQVLLTLYQVYL